MRRAAAGFLVGLLILTGCGDGSDADAGDAATSESSQSSETPPDDSGGDDDAGTTTTRKGSGSTSADEIGDDDPSSTDATTGGGSNDEDEATTSAPTSDGASRADQGGSVTEVTFRELFDHRQQYVGDTVRVVVKAFFLASCPPPGTGGQTEPCVLSLYLADPGRTDLLYGERDQALPGSEGGQRVSCVEGSNPGGGCPGWEHGATYEVVADVDHEVLGGRKSDSVQLDVREKRKT